MLNSSCGWNKKSSADFGCRFLEQLKADSSCTESVPTHAVFCVYACACSRQNLALQAMRATNNIL